MADDIDRAAEREEMERTLAQRLRKADGPVATGRCLHCDEIVGDAQRWCGAECRDAWEVDRRLTRRRA